MPVLHLPLAACAPVAGPLGAGSVRSLPFHFLAFLCWFENIWILQWRRLNIGFQQNKFYLFKTRLTKRIEQREMYHYTSSVTGGMTVGANGSTISAGPAVPDTAADAVTNYRYTLCCSGGDSCSQLLLPPVQYLVVYWLQVVTSILKRIKLISGLIRGTGGQATFNFGTL